MLVLEHVHSGGGLDGVKAQQGRAGGHALAFADQDLGDHAAFPVTQGLAARLHPDFGGR